MKVTPGLAKANQFFRKSQAIGKALLHNGLKRACATGTTRLASNKTPNPY